MPRFAPLAALAVAALLALLPTTASTAAFTSRSTNAPSQASAAADWSPPTVTLASVGDAIRGTVTLTATATDGETGVRQVAFAWSADGTTWTTICTPTVAPWTCSFPTTGLAEDYLELRAVATDHAGYSATSGLTGILVDNTAPTAALGTVATPLSGAVTIPVTATDAGSGVASAVVQHALAGTTTWTTICTDTTSPYSCRWDTTTVADATYDLRVVVTDVAGNVTTSATTRNRQVDNRISSISLDDPGAYLRGTATLSATAYSNVGITSVRIQRAPVGSSTWTDICTDTTSPYSCAWNTTTVTDGDYQLRAILLDGAAKTTTSTVLSPHRVDNSAVRGTDVQATNGGTLGQVGSGDRLVFSYSKVMLASSFVAGWDGSSRAVGVRLRDGNLLGGGAQDDALDVFTSTAVTTAVPLGSVAAKADYVTKAKTIVFDGTMSMQTVTVNGVSSSVVTVTLGSVVSGSTKQLRTVSSSPTMVWTPSAAALDLSGIATSITPVTESGTVDRDL